MSTDEKHGWERIQEDPIEFAWTLAAIGVLIAIPLGLILGLS
jgi:hypothetical protein